MLTRTWLRIWLSLLLGTTVAAAASAQTKLLRFPDLHGDRVVFTYAGDLWSASVEGGTATRLTAHPGEELFAKFSPDGQHLAFTGQYDGDEQVYAMTGSGGVPRQLTYYPAEGPLPPRWGYDNQVQGWTPDGERILFRSLRDSWDVGGPKLFTVSSNGDLPRGLPMPSGGSGAFSADGSKVVYSPLFRDFRHWKRYQGGWAQDLYLFDLETYASKQITADPRSDRDPMWIGDKIYFSSDRSGTLNLYVHDPATGETEALTDSTEWDVRWPSADEQGERIVYEQNGELVIYDLATRRAQPISIEVPTDGLAKRPARVAVGDQIGEAALSPSGKRALFAARGDLFTVPVEHGPVRTLTRTSGAHDRSPVWSPDGSTVAYISDQDGEDAVYLLSPPDGYGPSRRLIGASELGPRHLEGLAWSGDSRLLAFRDQNSKLYVISARTGKWQEIADDRTGFSMSYSWSPRGQFLAYTLAEETGASSIHIWSQQEKKSHRVTAPLFNEYAPSWDPAGDYLFYMSDREFGPQIGSFEFNYVVDRETAFYALALRTDVPHPLPPRSDEVEVEPAEDDAEEESDSDEAGKKKKARKEADGADDDEDAKADGPRKPFRIDFEGLGDRLVRLPVEADNYFALNAVEGGVLYARGFPFYYGRDPGQTVSLHYYSFEDREEKTLAEEIDDLVVSPDGSKILITEGDRYSVLSPDGSGEKKTLSTRGMAVDRVPAEEWEQIFHAVWRRFRDYFYVENMHGYDWQALRDRYAALLPHVGHRSDLNYLMSEMIAELNVSHAYVAGGDIDRPPRPQAALLGTRFELDEAAGRYRVEKILRGQNAEPRYRSPLTEVGLGVEVGDYLLAIGGQPLEADDNPYRLLRHAGGNPVELTVGASPELEKGRRILVEPIGDEDDLFYLAWVEENRRQVQEATGGRVGYLHLPDMGASGLREFIKWFYPQIRKQGLIIDVRSNGGGNVSGMILERLQRELIMLDFERNQDLVDTYPNTTFYGHLVCLLDEDTASDGDQFAYAFKQAGLGPLIGKRSWGGVVGIYGRQPLIDGGSVSVPEAGSAGLDGEWVIEGYGVDPDIVVENDPKELLAGRDQQLEKAIEVVLEQIEADPKILPGRPAPPDKTGR